MGYILNVNGIFVGLINLFILFDNIKFPNLAKERYLQLVFSANQYEVYLSAKKIGKRILSSLQRLFFIQYSRHLLSQGNKESQ